MSCTQTRASVWRQITSAMPSPLTSAVSMICHDRFGSQ